MNKHQKEYIYRINKVTDYIDQHFSEELDLNKISEIACFSPFHFHRIFSAIMGESLNNYIRRIRIEKAASLLRTDLDESISDIAVYVGFKNIPVFCRNFKQHYGISAGDFRKADYDPNSKNGQSSSKIDKTISPEEAYVCSVNSLKKRGFVMNKIEIKEMPELKLIYMRHTGAFDQIGGAYEKLFRWAGPRGLIKSPPVQKTVTVYHDDPGVTEMEKVRQSACLTVEQKIKTEGEIGYMEIPSGKYAVGRFEIGVDGFQDAWDSMCLWLTKSGYQPADAFPYELYHNNHEEHPEKKFILDICMPVKEM